ncbi:hypothetical protein MCHI_002963 [Candidatus Magnetoovum chiemensis]|nr:hypothetical protein MCHI_002963 [Candidatus Magnetoovum chiemensis]
MRQFFSYGPVDCRKHFCISRQNIVDSCLNNIVGDADDCGHYFTIWSPRQTGKTWIMRQVKDAIQAKYGDRFIAGMMSMQTALLDQESNPDDILEWVPHIIHDTFKIKIEPLKTWIDWLNIFNKSAGIFNKPVILFIDEFDKLPPKVIDKFVNLFRGMYLDRDSYLLHGLALIGVRAALGVESERGSPFNVQRSMHIPNFTKDEVFDLFSQYIAESGQAVETSVIEKVYESTNGQPGLVCWFGELLTDKYNRDKNKAIDNKLWDMVYNNALTVEWNNTILNLIKKVKNRYKEEVIELFSKSDIKFSLDRDWCSYLYMNGIIAQGAAVDSKGNTVNICRFSSPFVHERLYNALTDDLIGDISPIPSLDFLDDLADVFASDSVNVAALLERYKDYLKRLKSKGLNPWKDQPRRTDLHYTEAVGHFHLYAWLQSAIGRQCVISPEFPTGNGKVYLHLKCPSGDGIIEVKSFTNVYDLKSYKEQAAKYADSLGKETVTIALFVPSEDEDILKRLSSEAAVGGVNVTVVAIGWSSL